MDSENRYSYHWRMFIPLVVTLWLALLVIAYFQFEIKHQAGLDYLRALVQRVDNYVTSTINKGEDPGRTLNFVKTYLSTTPLEDISIAVYDAKTGERVEMTGFELPAPETDEHPAEFYKGASPTAIAIDDNGQRLSLAPSRAFYSNVTITDGDVYVVQTTMPYNIQVADYEFSHLDTRSVLVLFMVGLFTSAFAFFFTRHLSRNIILLRDFANRAAHDHNFVETESFPNDELGEISRQIVHIYNSRMQALLQREQEHLVALRATQERARIKRQLTNNINHELKTPTVIIRGYIDTILSDPEMPEKTRTRFLEKTKTQVERLVQMLGDLSTLTRLEEATQSIQTEAVNMHDLLFTVANDLNESGVMDDLEFIYDIPDNCVVRGNESLMSAMLMNLAKNSIAYAKCSAMGCKLIAQNDKYYTFSFWDNGVGVPPEALPHLFERFFRVDTGRSRKNGGTGLGLPIVKNTITMLGGSAIMRNRTGGGLECVFTLVKWSENNEADVDPERDAGTMAQDDSGPAGNVAD